MIFSVHVKESEVSILYLEVTLHDNQIFNFDCKAVIKSAHRA